MRDAYAVAQAPSRPKVSFGLFVLGLFSWSKKKVRNGTGSPELMALSKDRITVEGVRKEIALPQSESSSPPDPLRQDLRFQGLHEDINPSRSVKPSEMTCPSCDRHFRFFLNASGTKTPVACPGCGRQY